MIKSSASIDIAAARPKVTANAFSVVRAEIDFQKGKVRVLGLLGSDADAFASADLRPVSVVVTSDQLSTLKTAIETAVKKQASPILGFDDTKTSVQ